MSVEHWLQPPPKTTTAPPQPGTGRAAPSRLTSPAPNKIPPPSAPGHRAPAATNPANTSETGPTNPNNTPGYAQSANPAITRETLPHPTCRDRSKPPQLRSHPATSDRHQPKPPENDRTMLAAAKPPPSQTHVTPRPHSHRGDPTASASQIRAFVRTFPKRWPRKPEPTAGPRASEARQRPEPNQTNPKDISGSHSELQTGPMPKPKQQSHHQPSKAPASDKQRARRTVHACTRSAAPELHLCSSIELQCVRMSNGYRVGSEERFAVGRTER